MDLLDPVDALALRFYDAAADPALFAPLMADIGAYLKCTGGTFMVWDNIAGGFLFNATAGTDAESASRYDQYYGGIDPRHALMVKKVSGEIICCHEYFDDEFVAHNEAYCDFHIPIGARYMATTRLTSDREVSAYLNFARAAPMGPFDDAATAVIARLIPHAARAAKLSQRMAQLHHISERAEAALDQVGWSILIINGRGRVVMANQAAQTLLRERDGLSIVQGQLTAARARDQVRLSSLIHLTLGADRTGATDAGGALAIERPSGRSPLNLLAVPLSPGMAETLYARSGSIMITISNPAEQAVTPTAILTSLYGLSAREAAVALALAAGLSIAEIAETQKKSQETIRGQVKAAMFKTGTVRQSELVRIVLSLPRLRGIDAL